MSGPPLESFLNERHETRANFLKKDKDRLFKRLEDLEERLFSTKTTLQSILAFKQSNLSDNEKSTILDYLIEEKNSYARRINELSVINAETYKKSEEHRKKTNEILNREETIEQEMNNKLDVVLKESREKEQNIVRLSLKSETLSKEFKELAKKRLDSEVNSYCVKDLLVNKEIAIRRVLQKVNEFSHHIREENKEIEQNIEIHYKELSRHTNNSKYPLKFSKTLNDLQHPPVRNLLQADIRAKCESDFFQASLRLATPQKSPQGPKRSKKFQLNLENEFIKIESLFKELKNAEIINNSLHEDKVNLLAALGRIRKGAKQVTHKVDFQDSFKRKHRRVVSNPLDYWTQELNECLVGEVASKIDLDSKDLDQFSSVEEHNYDGPGDSMIDELMGL